MALAVFIFLLNSYSCKVKHSTKMEAQKPIWTLISASQIKQNSDSLPKKFSAFRLDKEELLKQIQLDSAQLKGIEFPMPDAHLVRYKITEVHVMAPALAAKYPQLKSYAGVEFSNPANRVRIDFNDKNFHAFLATNFS